MAFEAFTEKTSSGAFHQRRAIAYAAAACILVGLGVASARISNSAPPPPPKEPDPVDVTFEEKIEEEKPREPEPEPPPPALEVPKHVKINHEPPPPPPKEPDPVDVTFEEKIEEEKPREPEPEPPPPALEVPKHVKINHEPPPPPPKEPDPDTKAKLDEADPSKDKGVAGAHGGGDPNGKPGGVGTTPKPESKPEPPPPPPPPPAPKVIKPAMVSEDDIPAKGVSTPPPAYPAAARAAGVQGVVVVRLTIDEQGNVRDAKIVKGDSNFDDVVLAAVKSWKYEPAKHQDGKPFLSVKTVKIPFKIKM